MAADQEILVESDIISMENQQADDVTLPSYESIIRDGNTRPVVGKITIFHVLLQTMHFYRSK